MPTIYIAIKGDRNVGGCVSLCRFRGLISDPKDYQNEAIDEFRENEKGSMILSSEEKNVNEK